MIFQLKSTKNDSLLYLYTNKKYTIGRKDCDIILTDDKSISRQHAVLNVKDDHVLLIDLGAKYHTFLNGNKLDKDHEYILKDGDEIHFGMLGSKYSFFHISLVTTTSSIKNEQKIKLKSNLKYLGGSLAHNWTSQCTHVTVEEIILTVKVLCAIIKGIPIVNLKFWDDYVHNIKKSILPPNPVDYIPKCSEIMINENMSLNYVEERSSLFDNKVFLFSTKNDASKVEDMILLAGGEVLSCDVKAISLNEIINSTKEYLVVQVNDKIDPSLLEIVNYNKTIKKRTIPLQEIALAVVHCSCEKNCNPNFDRKSIVLASNSQPANLPTNILVLETQTQCSQLKNTAPSEFSVEQSLETFSGLSDMSSFKSVEVYSEDCVLLEDNSGARLKRDGDSINHLHAAKKIKINELQDFTPTSDKTKDIFVFKNTTTTNTTTTTVTSTDADNFEINVFSKKRKQTDNVESCNSKKRAITSTFEVCNTISKEKNQHNNKKTSTVNKEKHFKEHVAFKEILDVTNSRCNKSPTITEDTTLLKDIKVLSNLSWISKSHNETILKSSRIDHMDDEMKNYVELFKNIVVIAEEPLISNISINKSLNSNNNTYKNFKKFKKIQPLRIQTTILPESKYQNIICNKAGANLPATVKSDDEGNRENNTVVTPKKGKRFNF